jgi:2-C-methyl-D-erythritol 4-phosphate cytidylyltransferase
MSDKYWIIMPAAGIGKRFCSHVPKQYAKITDESVIELTLKKLLDWEKAAGIVVAINDKDTHWQDLSVASHPKVLTVAGGSSRIDSVHNALEYLSDRVNDTDLVLVHDSVRPCVNIADIDNLISQIASRDAIGGLLAYPVVDTLKYVDHDNSIEKTLSRRQLWQAATPQAFPLQILTQALAASQDDEDVTDEASSIEKLGHKPLVVSSSRLNIKITTQEDLVLAKYILRSQGEI